MVRRETLLRLLLRVAGGVMLLAVTGLAMPRSWMAWTHEHLGMGEFPPGVLVEYLARSLSGLYALIGAALLVMAGDLRRYRTPIRCVGAAFAVVGPTMGILLVGHLGQFFYWLVMLDALTAGALGVLILLLSARRAMDTEPAEAG